ncbi:MAG: hypothetical protein WCP33_05420 [Deltaproteobacteria bacterium]
MKKAIKVVLDGDCNIDAQILAFLDQSKNKSGALKTLAYSALIFMHQSQPAKVPQRQKAATKAVVTISSKERRPDLESDAGVLPETSQPQQHKAATTPATPGTADISRSEAERKIDAMFDSF